MKTKQWKIAAALTMLLALTAVATRDNEVTTSAGDLIINASGDKVIIEKPLNISSDGTTVAEIQSDGNITTDGSLEIGGNDADDKLEIKTTDDIPRIGVMGGTRIILETDAGDAQFDLLEQGTSAASVQTIRGLNDTGSGQIWLIGDNSAARDELVIRSIFAETRVQANGDNDDFWYINTTNNVPQIHPDADNLGTIGTTSNRLADVQSVLIQGADICFENNICFVECVIDNQIDICITYGKPTKDMAQSIMLSRYPTYQSYYQSRLEEDGSYNDISEEEFNTRKASITVNGKMDTLLGRTNYGSLRQLKNKITSIETTLCNMGEIQHC